METDVRATIQVPHLIGRGSHQAEPVVRDAGLALGVIRLTDTDQAGAGIILDQHPRPGRRVPAGSPVDITVASGLYG